MRVFASVIVAFVAAGCIGSAPNASTSSAVSIEGTPETPDPDPAHCVLERDTPGFGDTDTTNNPWINLNLSAGGYVVSTKGPTDADGNFNIIVFAYDPTLQTIQWWDSITSTDGGAMLKHYQTMPDTMPFVDPTSPLPPRPTPLEIRPDIEPQGGDDGVGQVGGTEVPLGGNGNEPGWWVCLDKTKFDKSQAGNLFGYTCTPKVTDPCGAARANCGSVTDDCNVLHDCGTCAGDLFCSTSNVCTAPRIFNPPPPPPCHGACI